jgi:PTH1 family peptidyl-tRNA hydrolase
MQYLIVGLGNIGAEYQHTRHNIGFDVLDLLAQDAGVRFSDQRYGAVAEMKIKGQTLTLLKPSTYMNLSGNAVRYWMQQKKIPLEHVLVIVDDLALPFGSLRLRPDGSDAGHNGLKHIQETLGTTKYARLRFGIGNDFPKGRQIEYVLGGWSPEQLDTMPDRMEMAGKIIQSFCLSGIQRTMNDYNKR